MLLVVEVDGEVEGSEMRVGDSNSHEGVRSTLILIVLADGLMCGRDAGFAVEVRTRYVPVNELGHSVLHLE